MKSIFPAPEWRTVRLTVWLYLAIFLAAILTGHGWTALWLWYVPSRLGALLLNIFFQWLPHHPFDTTDRYRNTRISLWPGGEIVLLWQNLHLMHHLGPGVPFYRLGRMYRALAPHIAERHARIEGFLPGSPPPPCGADGSALAP